MKAAVHERVGACVQVGAGAWHTWPHAAPGRSAPTLLMSPSATSPLSRPSEQHTAFRVGVVGLGLGLRLGSGLGLELGLGLGLLGLR